ncbi:ammonium transporter [Demequina lignilytica]|uniref:Ammonium transporter n=1 Tax=Demequina lignilytica TaxID=3051663 RepID=A0AAW7M5S1_9MICO|nr:MULTISPECIES: ammonium transporter [unclassified Demequina]MDN4477223.1 ammonium transporter [Demequina sp. SYSU T00039-1]MDN4483749.1 ammonium transporter [Demequina sp. SYSU T0a273]MDN4487396.1 ammonium transporter [Demequina sp. SYSU T00039]MDN4491149.1 ammonium transporter [Demequina sp. SYSU T00068]
MAYADGVGAVGWLLVSASLVLLMTPALAFFYGGMSRSKSVLNMMMMSFGAMGVGVLAWVLFGYSISGGGETVNNLFGDPFGDFGMIATLESGDAGAIIAAGFGATFAIITVALISGSVADRMKFGSWLVFAFLWVILVYSPVAHWVWGTGTAGEGFDALLGGGGPLFADLPGPYDFAGGTVVHINAGVAGLVLALLLGIRKGFGKEPMRPHNLPFVMLGAALLWFGWFGFNAGSAFAADSYAAVAWVNTTVATAIAMLGWLITEKIRDGKATSLGAASGVVAGLVSITPACASVDTWGAIIIGFFAGVLSALAVGLKYKLGYDDSLDVVGVHLVSGLWGTLAIGLVATEAINGDAGLFFGGGITLLGVQAAAAAVTIVYSAIATLIIGLLIKYTMGLRVSEDVEVSGIDLAVHGETAYEEVK